MSKITMAPNASGTGTFTIASPNSNSDRTLTLPDNTGTVVTTGSTGGVSQSMLAAGVAGNGPSFNAYNSANVSCSNGTSTKITVNTERWDTASCFDTSTYRFTPNVAGYYQVSACAYCGDSPVNTFLEIKKNGASEFRGNQSASQNVMFLVNGTIYLNGTTDYIELWLTNNNGGTITVNNYSFTNQFSAFLARSA